MVSESGQNGLVDQGSPQSVTPEICRYFVQALDKGKIRSRRANIDDQHR